MLQPDRRRFLQSAAVLASGMKLAGAAAASRTREARCDILIAGGSLGGVAAALAAARMGRTVILTEETNWIGGQATTQGVPLDEHPWIENFGRTASYADFRNGVRDYYRRLYPLTPEARADRYLNPGACWVSACGFEPRVGIAVLEAMLAPHLTAGRVRIWTGHRPVAVDSAQDRCRSVTFDSERSGRVTVSADYILDATELGDLLPLAGVEFITGAESGAQTGEPSALQGPAEPLKMQPFTHLFAVDHLPGENFVIEKPSTYQKWLPQFRSLAGIAAGPDVQMRMRRLFAPPDANRYHSSIWNFRRAFYAGNFAKGAFASDVTMLMNGNEYRDGLLCGVSEAEAARARTESRELSLSLLYFLQTAIEPGYQGKPGFPGIRPRGDVFGTTDGLAQYPYIREGRRIRAVFTVLEQHFRIDLHPDGPVRYKDSVGVSGYRMDIHEAARSGGSSQTIALHGKHWPQQIPLGALLPVRMENLLPACKNLGTTHVTNGAFRVHPAEWNIGEVAGALAAYCLNHKTSPRKVHSSEQQLADFQRSLQDQGVELTWPGLDFARSYNSHYADVPDWYFGEADKRVQK
jgi:hypothetical protein